MLSFVLIESIARRTPKPGSISGTAGIYVMLFLRLMHSVV